MDLTRWDTGFLLLSFNGFLDRDVFFDTKFSHVLLEVRYTLVHLVGMSDKLLSETFFVDTNLSVLKGEPTLRVLV